MKFKLTILAICVTLLVFFASNTMAQMKDVNNGLAELYDVVISAVQDGDGFTYNSNTGLWENGTITASSEIADSLNANSYDWQTLTEMETAIGDSTDDVLTEALVAASSAIKDTISVYYSANRDTIYINTLTFIDADGNLISFIGGEDRVILESSTGKSELHVDYITGAIAPGTEHSVIHINIEDDTATGGLVHAIDVADVGTGTVTVVGLGTFSNVIPVKQSIGTFSTPDKVLKVMNAGADTISAAALTTAFGDAAKDTTLFESDDDEVMLGAAAVFNEIEVILNTAASGPGIKPTFWYSSGSGSFTPFNPEDGSNGMRDSGIINWVSGDLSWTTWDYKGVDQYWIKIIRTQGNISTPPIEDTFKILASTDYEWDENGIINVAGIDGTPIGATTPSTGAFTTLSVDSTLVYSHGTTWDLADSTWTGQTVVWKAHENLTFGQLVYLDGDQEYALAQANALSTTAVDAMALGTISANAYGLFLLEGYVKRTAWTTITVAEDSTWVYLDDDTAGLAVIVRPPDTGDQVIKVGKVVALDIIKLKISDTILGVQ